MQDPHTADLQGEHRGCDGGAEQGGKHRAHAAEHGDALFLFVQVKVFPEAGAEAAADLQRCAFTPGAAAQQMGDHGADKDRRQQKNVYQVPLVDRTDNVIRVLADGMRQVIEADDRRPADGQKPDQPGVLRPQKGGEGNAFVEN